MESKESKEEIQVREALEAALDPDETLLAFTQATYDRSRPVRVGLSGRRILMVLQHTPTKAASSNVLAFSRYLLSAVTWSKGASYLILQFEKEKLILTVKSGLWKSHAAEFAELSQQTSVPKPSLQTLIQDIKAIEKRLSIMPLSPAGLEEIGQQHPEAVELLEEWKERIFAHRAVSIFLLVDIPLTALPYFLFPVEGLSVDLILSSLIGIYFAYNLWRGKVTYRLPVIIFTAIFWVNSGLLPFFDGYYIGSALITAYSLPIFLALIGKPSRTRTTLSILLYAIFYVGGTGFLILSVLFSQL